MSIHSWMTFIAVIEVIQLVVTCIHMFCTGTVVYLLAIERDW